MPFNFPVKLFPIFATFYRPTIIVGDSGGLSEYLRDFLLDNGADEERVTKFCQINEMHQYKVQ